VQSFDVVWDTEQGGWFHLYPIRTCPRTTACTGPAPTRTGTRAARNATRLATTRPTTPRPAAMPPPRPRSGWGARPVTARARRIWPGPGTPRRRRRRATASPSPSPRPRRRSSNAPPAIRGARRTRRLARPRHALSRLLRLALLRPGLYHADGQILDEVYVTARSCSRRCTPRAWAASIATTPTAPT
jgi:hypothetical protein